MFHERCGAGRGFAGLPPGYTRIFTPVLQRSIVLRWFDAHVHRMLPFALCPALSFALSMTQVGPSCVKKEERTHLRAGSFPSTVH